MEKSKENYARLSEDTHRANYSQVFPIPKDDTYLKLAKTLLEDIIDNPDEVRQQLVHRIGEDAVSKIGRNVFCTPGPLRRDL